LLLPQYDQLFDKGLISFDDRGGIVTSPVLDQIDHAKIGINPNDRLRSLSTQHKGFLEYHQAEVFVRFTE